MSQIHLEDLTKDGLKPGSYSVIYADFPWNFRSYSGEELIPTVGGQPYKPMSVKDLKALPIPDLAGKDCLLLMWVVSHHFDTAIDCIREYGFNYKSLAFNWVKTKQGLAEQGALFYDDAFMEDANPLGMGYWTRQQTELCLLATRGKPERKSSAVKSLITAPRREHSRKPDIYDRIEELADGPYLEMFSRTNRPGWHSWGNQTGMFKEVK